MGALVNFLKMANPDYKPSRHYGDGGPTIADLVTSADLDGLRSDIADLRRRVAILEGHRRPDQVKWYHAGDFADGGQQQADLAQLTAGVVPWISTVSRITGELTSAAFAKQTWGDAGLMAVVGGLLGCGVALAFELPWTIAPAGAGAAFCVSASVLLLHRRALLHKVVTQQGRGGAQANGIRYLCPPGGGRRLSRADQAHVSRWHYDRTAFGICAVGADFPQPIGTRMDG